MTAAGAVQPSLQSSLQPAGPVAAATAEMTWVLSIGAALVFAVVMLALGWALVRALQRRKEAQWGAPDAPDAPDISDISDIPGAPGAAGAYVQPGALGTLGAPGMPGRPGRPETQGRPETPETPETREASDTAGPPGPPSSRRSTWWWIAGAGVAFPVLVLLPLLVYATLRTNLLTPPRMAPAGDELLITVEGRLWWWKVSYRQADGSVAAVSANQINLPVGRPVTLALVSGDVIHSFWVPALAGKVDMVPGKVHHLRLQADAPGVYRGQCAEFCGEQHARMALHVVAQAPADFERWLQGQSQPAVVPQDADAARGLYVFAERRCGACHGVRGLEAVMGPRPDIGPDLTHVASRLHIGAGTVPFERQALAQWVAHPQTLKPGVRMPAYEMDAAAMDALVRFLMGLQ